MRQTERGPEMTDQPRRFVRVFGSVSVTLAAASAVLNESGSARAAVIDLYVAEGTTGAVTELNSSGTFVKQFSTGLSTPEG